MTGIRKLKERDFKYIFLVLPKAIEDTIKIIIKREEGASKE